MYFDNNLQCLKISFKFWGYFDKFVIILTDRNKKLFWVNNVEFNTNVPNYSEIESSNINKEFNDLCIVIDSLLKAN